MLLLGIIGVVQVTWLPGFLFLKIGKIRTNWISNLVFGFALSLIFNYLLVLILATFKIFFQWILILLIVIEALIVIWLYRNILLSRISDVSNVFWKKTINFFSNAFHEIETNLAQDHKEILFRKLLYGILFCFALIPIWWMVRVFINNLGTVFNTWDAVVVYNDWATQWALNTIPQNTWHYPQLIPTNWALIYVLTKSTNVQLFAKAIMPLFLFSILLLTIALGLKQRNPGFFLGCLIAYFVIKHFLGEYIADGYLDIPVAAMSFATIATLFWARQSKEKDTVRIIFLGAILAGGTAVTKHTGLYILAAFPILAYLLIIRRSFQPVSSKTLKLLIMIVLISIIIASPWYIYKEINFMSGKNETEAGIYQLLTFSNTTILQRMQNISIQLGKYLALYFILLFSIFFIEKDYRWIALIVILPFSVIWALFLSYDTRNLAIALPFLSVICGIGLVSVIDWMYRKVFRRFFERIHVLSIVILITLLLMASPIMVKDQTIINQQITMQKQIFSKNLNAQLYSFFGDQNLSEIKILTNYPIRFLPGFEESQVNYYYDDLSIFQAEVQNLSIDYLLVPSYARADIQDAIQVMLVTGKLKFLLDDHSWIGYSLYQIIR
jgi:hypothetical protein